MKNSKVLNGYLVVAGLLLSFIGGATLLAPVAMKASAGIDVSGNISVLNDVRAASALILSTALISILGAFKSRLRFTSTLMVSVLFLSLGAGRLVSIIADGMPVDGLVKATGLEFVLGIIGAVLLIMNKEKNQ